MNKRNTYLFVISSIAVVVGIFAYKSSSKFNIKTKNSTSVVSIIGKNVIEQSAKKFMDSMSFNEYPKSQYSLLPDTNFNRTLLVDKEIMWGSLIESSYNDEYKLYFSELAPISVITRVSRNKFGIYNEEVYCMSIGVYNITGNAMNLDDRTRSIVHDNLAIRGFYVPYKFFLVKDQADFHEFLIKPYNRNALIAINKDDKFVNIQSLAEDGERVNFRITFSNDELISLEFIQAD